MLFDITLLNRKCGVRETYAQATLYVPGKLALMSDSGASLHYTLEEGGAPPSRLMGQEAPPSSRSLPEASVPRDLVSRQIRSSD